MSKNKELIEENFERFLELYKKVTPQAGSHDGTSELSALVHDQEDQDEYSQILEDLKKNIDELTDEQLVELTCRNVDWAEPELYRRKFGKS